jgi:hypothetical protein
MNQGTTFFVVVLPALTMTLGELSRGDISKRVQAARY